MTKKLTAFLLLLMLLVSCVKPATTPLIEPCHVTRLGPIHLETAECGDFVCIDVATAVALSIWINDVLEYRRSVSRCPYTVIGE